MADFIYKNKKLIGFFIALIFGLIVLISVGFVIYQRIFSAKINIMVAPTIAKVIVAGQEYNAMGEHKIRPGEYAVEISAEGFETKYGNLVVKADETTNIWVYLEPSTGNEDWYDTHAEDALIMGEIKNAQTMEAMKELTEENPIMNKLPVEVEYFTDDYSEKIKYTISYKTNTEDSSITIYIYDYTGGNYERALLKLDEVNDEKREYEIVYEDLSDEGLGGYAE